MLLEAGFGCGPEAFRDKRVLVLGMARSGLAAAALLRSLGARVLVCDRKPAHELPDAVAELQRLGCTCLNGPELPKSPEGMDLVVPSPGIPPHDPLLVLARARGLPVVGELELASRAARGDLIAVTGTNGKTTTVSLLGEIFSRTPRRVHVAGNIGYPFSAAALRSQRDDRLVVEVSSFQLESVDCFHPRVAAVLNVTPDHLDRHGCFEVYRELKERIFRRQTKEDTTVLNLDDPVCREMAPRVPGRVLWFSRREVPAEGAWLRDGRLLLRREGKDEEICPAESLKIPGKHNLENALAAAAVAAAAGADPPGIAAGLGAFAGVEHRIETVCEHGGIRFINDSKGTNPDSTIRAIEAMDRPTVLIAGGYDKQVSFEPLAKSVAAGGQITHAVLMGQTAGAIGDALEKEGFSRVSLAKDLKEAVQTAARLARKGENVLFSPACASFDMFLDYEQRGRLFKDCVRGLCSRGGPDS